MRAWMPSEQAIRSSAVVQVVTRDLRPNDVVRLPVKEEKVVVLIHLKLVFDVDGGLERLLRANHIPGLDLWLVPTPCSCMPSIEGLSRGDECVTHSKRAREAGDGKYRADERAGVMTMGARGGFAKRYAMQQNISA